VGSWFKKRSPGGLARPIVTIAPEACYSNLEWVVTWKANGEQHRLRRGTLQDAVAEALKINPEWREENIP
jgi:hypothetical protein